MKTAMGMVAAAVALAAGLGPTALAWDNVEEIKGNAEGAYFGGLSVKNLLRGWGSRELPGPIPEPAWDVPEVKAVKDNAARAPELGEKGFNAEAKAAIERQIETEGRKGTWAVVTALRVDPVTTFYKHTHTYEAWVVITTFEGSDRFDQEYKIDGFYNAASKKASVARKELVSKADKAAAKMREIVAQEKADRGILRLIKEVSLEKDFLGRPRLKLLAGRPEHRKERDKFEDAVDWNFSCDRSWHCDPDDRPMMGFGIGYRIEYAKE